MLRVKLALLIDYEPREDAVLTEAEIRAHLAEVVTGMAEVRTLDTDSGIAVQIGAGIDVIPTPAQSGDPEVRAADNAEAAHGIVEADVEIVTSEDPTGTHEA